MRSETKLSSSAAVSGVGGRPSPTTRPSRGSHGSSSGTRWATVARRRRSTAAAGVWRSSSSARSMSTACGRVGVARSRLHALDAERPGARPPVRTARPAAASCRVPRRPVTIASAPRPLRPPASAPRAACRARPPARRTGRSPPARALRRPRRRPMRGRAPPSPSLRTARSASRHRSCARARARPPARAAALGGAHHDARRGVDRIAVERVRPPRQRADDPGEHAPGVDADAHGQRSRPLDDRARRAEHQLLFLAAGGARRAREEDRLDGRPCSRPSART